MFIVTEYAALTSHAVNNFSVMSGLSNENSSLKFVASISLHAGFMFLLWSAVFFLQLIFQKIVSGTLSSINHQDRSSIGPHQGPNRLQSMRGSRKFCQRGFNTDNVF